MQRKYNKPKASSKQRKEPTFMSAHFHSRKSNVSLLMLTLGPLQKVQALSKISHFSLQ